MAVDSDSSKFTLRRMMVWMLFVSLLMAATFVRSNIVFAISSLAVVLLVVWYCVDAKCRPEFGGALLGLTFPALVAMHLIGELYVPVAPDQFRRMEDNIPTAIVTLVFGGGVGAWFGTLVGMVFGIVKEKLVGRFD